MKIRYSTDGELSIEGNQKEMESFSKEIYVFLESGNTSHNFELDAEYDPFPYEQVIKQMKFSKAKENNIVINGYLLTFAGENIFLKVSLITFHMM